MRNLAAQGQMKSPNLRALGLPALDGKHVDTPPPKITPLSTWVSMPNLIAVDQTNRADLQQIRRKWARRVRPFSYP